MEKVKVYRIKNILEELKKAKEERFDFRVKHYDTNPKTNFEAFLWKENALRIENAERIVKIMRDNDLFTMVKLGENYYKLTKIDNE